jgi:olfactory receptor
MFCIYVFSGMESAVLVAMAYDHFMANCCPLHYTLVLTNKVIFIISWVILLRSLFFLPCPLSCSPYGYHFISTKSPFTFINVISIYGLCATPILICDIVAIIISYVQIFSAAFQLSSQDAQLRHLAPVDLMHLSFDILHSCFLFIYDT